MSYVLLTNKSENNNHPLFYEPMNTFKLTWIIFLMQCRIQIFKKYNKQVFEKNLIFFNFIIPQLCL